MSTIPSGQKFHTVASNINTVERGSALSNAGREIYTMQDIIDTVGGGLEGNQYVFVAANGTDVQNAAELQAAYVTAQGMSPSATNRITVIAAPGNYNFGSTTFIMDTQYIDLVSLDGNMSIIFNSASAAGTISITANDVFVKGVDVVNKIFVIGGFLNLLKVEKCRGNGTGSFGGAGIYVSGTFTNCIGGTSSFGGEYGEAAGTFINCTGGTRSFAGNGGEASGIFINCVGGNESFSSDMLGGPYGQASGTFTNCTAGSSSFGAGTYASGVFTNCTGGGSISGNGCFGGGLTGFASGTFTNCICRYRSVY
jgi:hypothetical protein